MKYMKQLDALRAFAVFGVLYHHMVNNKTKLLPFNLGLMGVDLFYVLSGFLITGILLNNKIRIDNGDETKLVSIKNFFTRRTLRILPIYYLTLLVAYIFSVPPVRETLWWHICYATNFYIAYTGSWPGSISHLWSLAVEEQFYLIWPWIILLVPRKQLLAVLIFVVTVGPLFRYICDISHANNLVALVVTLGNMDLFGIGALLAYLKTFNLIDTKKSQLFLRLCLYVGGFMFAESLLLKVLKIENQLDIFFRTFEGFLFCWIIYKASIGFEGVIGSILEFKPLLYLGRISYGIYLYHNFVPGLTPNILSTMHITVPTSISVLFIIYVMLTIIMASISWYLIEKPISIIKNKYEASTKSS